MAISYLNKNIDRKAGYHVVKKIRGNKKVIKVVKPSGEYDILTVEEKSISLIGNRTKIIPGMNQ